jgi:membrane-bound lytic murein transglycosylase D
MDFESVAQLAGVSASEIRDLNPALLGRITPPFGSYALRLPVGAGERLEEALRGGEGDRMPQWGIHRVTRTQSLADVARLYQTTAQRLAEVNHLPGGRLRGVSELVVPVSRVAASVPEERRRPVAIPVSVAAPAKSGSSVGPGPGAPSPVVVRRGDTLGGIASRHGITAESLARWNGLDLKGPLSAGTRLRLTPP